MSAWILWNSLEWFGFCGKLYSFAKVWKYIEGKILLLRFGVENRFFFESLDPKINFSFYWSCSFSHFFRFVRIKVWNKESHYKGLIILIAMKTHLFCKNFFSTEETIFLEIFLSRQKKFLIMRKKNFWTFFEKKNLSFFPLLRTLEEEIGKFGP